MGKPFAAELTRIADTIAWVETLNISPLAYFFAQANGSPLITIGAGGSFTTAEMARLLFESRGGVGISHTPLSFLQNLSSLRDANILLYTAGGNNRDVLAIFNAAVEREAKGIFVVCGSARSKIAARISDCPQAKLFIMPMPAGKDGYLATNSLIAFSAATIRAFAQKLPSPKTINQLIAEPDALWKAPKGKSVTPFYLALYGDWARPAAVDLESKFSEAGLGGVMVADYRNFAHGRHNWIDKRGEESTVLAFITPETAMLAKKTLQLLPPKTRIVEFKTETLGPSGGLELILRVFCYTALIGRARGIDPGRPGVPSYGSRIYRLGPVIYSKSRSSNLTQLQSAAVNRKLSARGTLGDEADNALANQAFATFLERLQQTQFGALVADFDGTVARPGIDKGALDKPVTAIFTKLLKHRVPVYFATGRGNSIHTILEASFPASLWNRIFVSYYNGAVTRPLADASSFNENELPSQPGLKLVFQIIQQNALLKKLTRPSDKHCQLTIKILNHASVGIVSALIEDIVAQYARTTLRVVRSSHSIDIVPIERTKLTCVELAQSRLPSAQSVLTLGDRGARPGNDFDLLTHSLSLSVDSVSTALDSCWNILPAGVRNIAGLCWYGKWIAFRDDSFTLQIPDHLKTKLSRTVKNQATHPQLA